MINLDSKIALVTGASRGIGREAAKKLHSLGAFVYISATNEEKLLELESELGSNCKVIVADLSKKEHIENIFKQIDHLDILVCNAGITKDSLTMKMKQEAFDDVININLKANFLLNQLAVNKMIRQRYGRIINISSVVAFSGNAGQANYCASKAGLVGMTKSIALEVATRGVTVNSVAPGFIESDMTAKLTDEQKDLIKSKIPSRKFGKTEDVADAVCFLASESAAYITGQTIHVNGGMLMV